MEESEKGIETRFVNRKRGCRFTQAEGRFLVVVEKQEFEGPEILQTVDLEFEESELLICRESIEFLALDFLNAERWGYRGLSHSAT